MPDRHDAGSRPWGWLGLVLPFSLALALLVLDWAEGPKTQYVGLLVACPALASALVGPLATALVGAVTLGMAFGFGFLQQNDTLTGSAAYTEPQMVRLVGILAAGVIAVVVARVRTARTVRLQRLTQISEVAQRTIMRDLPPTVADVGAAARYQSATSEARVGGDLYEVIDTPYGVRALVGDARGKGLDAVRLSGHVLGSFRELAWSEPDLARVAAALDHTVIRVGTAEDFVTATLLELRGDGLARIVECGHPAPLLLPPPSQTPGTGRRRRRHRRDTREPLPVRALESGRPSPPLGLLAGDPVTFTAPLAGGERVLLLTDGLVEARRRGQFLDVPATVGAAFRAEDLGQALDEVIRTVRRWVRGRVDDDLALVALQIPDQIVPATGGVDGLQDAEVGGVRVTGCAATSPLEGSLSRAARS